MNIVLCYPVEACHVQQIAQVAPSAHILSASQTSIPEMIMDADVFCGHAKQLPVPWDRVVQKGRLRWIQSTAAGLDHCLTREVIDSDIVVTGASGLFADPVAEQTLALLLGLLRRLHVFFRAADRREFIRRPTADLHGTTIGIVGLGGNGRRLAELLAPFRTRILATDYFPCDQPETVQRLVSPDHLHELLPECDIVILCVPLNDTTRGMFDRDTIGRMKKGALLINVARGPVVVEEDLVAALTSGHLSGAGLDVTEQEPLPATSRLWELPNIIITPHVGAQSSDRIDRTTSLFCTNLQKHLAGQPLCKLVDKQLGFPRYAWR